MTIKNLTEKARNKTGPKPETVKIEGDWEEAVAIALTVKPPKEGEEKPKANEDKKKGD